MTLSEAYALLRKHYKSHGAAAKNLGMTQQHYNALRNGRANMRKQTEDYILLKAEQVAAEEMPPVAQSMPPGPEPRA